MTLAERRDKVHNSPEKHITLLEESHLARYIPLREVTQRRVRVHVAEEDFERKMVSDDDVHWRSTLPATKFATVKDFWDELDKYFVDPNLAKTAQARLEKCYMGNREANDFFQDFEELVLQAGFKTTDAHVLDILQRNARTSIIQTIYASGNEPTNYDAWKLRIKNIDTLWHKGQIIMRGTHTANPHPSSRNSTSTHNNSHPTPCPPAPAPQVTATTPAPAVTRRDGTGVMYGGRGEPMDLDHACVKCGKKKSEAGLCQSPWHIPNRNAQQQRVRRVWEDPDAREEFLKAMRLYAAEDPEDFTAQGFDAGST
ncbi:hypothetical protein C8Q74DRAFT_1444135 [Fomes fomentarius]|nr:hypothetical protein C8Q74DRAFT_1444135 [Fomes fomentarius]